MADIDCITNANKLPGAHHYRVWLTSVINRLLHREIHLLFGKLAYGLEHKTSLFSNTFERREGRKIMFNTMSNDPEPIGPLLCHNAMSIVNMELNKALPF